MTPEPNGYYYEKCGRRGVTSSTPFRITGLVSIIWSQYIFLKNKGVVRDCILKLRLMGRGIELIHGSWGAGLSPADCCIGEHRYIEDTEPSNVSSNQIRDA